MGALRRRFAPDAGTIGLREMAAYFLVNVGNIPIMTLLNMFIMSFYTDVVELDPAAIGTLFLIARVIDGFNDPIIGYIVDHLPKTKMGRFRPYIILGAAICGLNYLLLWLGPLWSPGGKLTIAYISYLLIGITFDLMDVPLNSMIPVMTDRPKERNMLSSVKAVGYAIGAGIVSLPIPYILEAMPDRQDIAYTGVSLIAVAITVAFSTIGSLGIRERIQAVADQRYHLRDLFRVVTEKPVMVTFLTQLLNSIGGAAGSAAGIYYAKYILHDQSLLSIFSILTVAGGAPALLLAPFLTERFGKRTVFSMGLFIPAVTNLLRLLAYRNVPWVLITGVLGAFGGGLTLPMSYGIQADNVDYIDFTHGQRAEGAVASLNSFVIKASSGIGGALASYILKGSGYVANAQNQSRRANAGILANYAVLPAVFAIFAAALFRFAYPITNERMAEITQTLQQRRAQNGEAPAAEE